MRFGREWWRDYSQIVANLTVIAALAVAAISLYDSRLTLKRERTAERLSELTSGNLISAQMTLLQLWVDRDLSSVPKSLPRDTIDALVEKTISASDVPRNEVVEAIVVLTTHFDDLGACLKEQLCELSEVNSAARLSILDFHCLYSGQIERIARMHLMASLGTELEKLSDKLGGCGAT